MSKKTLKQPTAGIQGRLQQCFLRASALSGLPGLAALQDLSSQLQ